MGKRMGGLGLAILLALGLGLGSGPLGAEEKASGKKEAPATQPATPTTQPAKPETKPTAKEEAKKPVTPGPLDGKSFTGEIGEKGKKADPDTFVFKDGRFTSTACEKFGFKDAAYTTSGEGKNMRFRATTMNPAGAKIDWDGVITGDKLEGKAVLNQPGKPAEDKMFKAKITK